MPEGTSPEAMLVSALSSEGRRVLESIATGSAAIGIDMQYLEGEQVRRWSQDGYPFASTIWWKAAGNSAFSGGRT
jgi:hypothetical protein